MNKQSDARFDKSGEPGLPAVADADVLIAAHGGDARAVIIKLLAQVEALRRENQYLAGAVSRGFIRAPLPREPK